MARAILLAEPGVRLDYLELRDAATLQAVPELLCDPAVLLVAGFVGATRLIDNLILR